MDKTKLYKKFWPALYVLVSPFVKARFNVHVEPCEVDGPCLVISNHVTNWDPLMLALSFKHKQMYFVASEHVFRLGPVSTLLNLLVGLIPRRKASSGADTVITCLRKLRAGESVCIFGEGDACWDGISAKVLPATGKLARSSGVTLVTYRLEGGYLSLPRWSKRIRKGKICGRIAGVYPPEVLKAMKPNEITDIINRDIYEDAWQRNREWKQRYKGQGMAAGIERGLFLCPKCGGMDSIKSRGDHFSCSCGLKLRYTEYGLFDPPEPFENFAQWDKWQHEKLWSGDFEHEGNILFSDENVLLREIKRDHSHNELCREMLIQYEDAISCGDYHFPLKDIDNMAMVKNHILLFSVADSYYELRVKKRRCLRRYLAVWRGANLASD